MPRVTVQVRDAAGHAATATADYEMSQPVLGGYYLSGGADPTADMAGGNFRSLTQYRSFADGYTFPGYNRPWLTSLGKARVQMNMVLELKHYGAPNAGPQTFTVDGISLHGAGAVDDHPAAPRHHLAEGVRVHAGHHRPVRRTAAPRPVAVSDTRLRGEHPTRLGTGHRPRVRHHRERQGVHLGGVGRAGRAGGELHHQLVQGDGRCPPAPRSRSGWAASTGPATSAPTRSR